jgi:hypothetical protein
LVVDDELDSSAIFRIALEDNRFDVQKVLWGQAARSSTTNCTIDCKI